MELKEIKFYLKRLYKNYVKEHLWRLVLALALSVVVAGTTASIAWLLDPAVKKIFIENDRTFAFVIPIVIIIVFSAKGLSLYFARYLIIVLGFRVIQNNGAGGRQEVYHLHYHVLGGGEFKFF